MKVKTGFLENVKGKLGNFVFKPHGSGTILSKKTVPYSVSMKNASTAQEAIRENYRNAIAIWETLSSEERESLNEMGAASNISGFNYLLCIMPIDQEHVTGDTTEASTWDTTISSLLNNLNRIRNQITVVTGESWGTVSHTIAAVWAKFNESTGHAHSGAADDGGQVSHSSLGNLDADDHEQYFLADASRPISNTFVGRDVDDSYLALVGGNGSGHGGVIAVAGKNATYAYHGGALIDVMNSAKTGYITAFYINGNTDTPTPVFAGLKRGATSVSDGGTITHGCGTTPTSVVVIGSVANEILAVTAKSSTTFTVAIKKRSTGSAGTTQTVYWMAWL